MILLITGCAGLIGGRFAEWVLTNKPDVTVIGIDDLSGGLQENLDVLLQYPNFVFRKLNCDDATIEQLFIEYKITHIAHFACWAAETASPFMRKFTTQNIMASYANLVNMAIKYDIVRFLQASTLAVYGAQVPPFQEFYLPLPADYYGVLKAAIERDLANANAQHGLDYVICRFHNVYGKMQNAFDPLRNFIGICLYKGIIGDPITVYGDGLQTRQFSEASDILIPTWNALTMKQASTEIFNIGGTKESTILGVAQIVSKLTGVHIIHLPPRHEVQHATVSSKKSEDILEFVHTIELEDGITSMYEWVKTLPLRPRIIFDQYELQKGLYDYWRPEALKDGYFKENK